MNNEELEKKQKTYFEYAKSLAETEKKIMLLLDDQRRIKECMAILARDICDEE